VFPIRKYAFANSGSWRCWFNSLRFLGIAIFICPLEYSFGPDAWGNHCIQIIILVNLFYRDSKYSISYLNVMRFTTCPPVSVRGAGGIFVGVGLRPKYINKVIIITLCLLSSFRHGLTPIYTDLLLIVIGLNFQICLSITRRFTCTEVSKFIRRPTSIPVALR
jgi:hypothetical protein